MLQWIKLLNMLLITLQTVKKISLNLNFSIRSQKRFLIFFGISSESLFYVDLGISKHVFLLFFVSFIVVSTIVTLIQGYISHKKNIPNKFMSIIEMFVIYLRDDVLKNFIGDKEYRSWAPLVYTIFFFVLFGNVLGLIPIFDLTGLIGKIGYKAEMLGKDNILYLLSKGGHTVTANKLLKAKI